MKWIKITNKSDLIPEQEFIATDGKSLALKLNTHGGYHMIKGKRFFVEDTTHYMLIEEIPLPRAIDETD